jgi:hypothetical protein
MVGIMHHLLAGYQRPLDPSEGLSNLNLADIPVGGSVSNAPSNWSSDPQAVTARKKVINKAREISNNNRSFFQSAEFDIKSATPTVMVARLKGSSTSSIASGFKLIHESTPRTSANLRMLTGHLNTAVNEIKIKTSSGFSTKLNVKDNGNELDAVQTADNVLGKLTTVFEHMHTTGKTILKLFTK